MVFSKISKRFTGILWKISNFFVPNSQVGAGTFSTATLWRRGLVWWFARLGPLFCSCSTEYIDLRNPPSQKGNLWRAWKIVQQNHDKIQSPTMFQIFSQKKEPWSSLDVPSGWTEALRSFKKSCLNCRCHGLCRFGTTHRFRTLLK